MPEDTVLHPAAPIQSAAADIGGTRRLLIGDDQPHILEALEILLLPEGYRLSTARSPALVLDCFAHQEFDGVLLDLNYTRDTTSGLEGLDLIAAIRERDALIPIIVMTAYANVDLAVEAMRRGANDFVQKPWDNPRLLTVLRNQTRIASCPQADAMARS
jgi:DNA-binding NtrC family response regulator